MKEFIKLMDKQNKKNVAWIVLWGFMLIMFIGALHPTVDTGRKKAIALLVFASIYYYSKYFYIFSEKRSKSGENKTKLKEIFTIIPITDGKDVIPDVDMIDVMKHHAFDLKEYMNILRKRIFCVSIISAAFIAIYGLGMKIKYNSFSKYFFICIIIIAILPTALSYLMEYIFNRYLFNNRSHGFIHVARLFIDFFTIFFLINITMCCWEFVEKTIMSLLCSRNVKGNNSFLFYEYFGGIHELIFTLTVMLYIFKDFYSDSRKTLLRISIVAFILSMIYLYGNRGYYQDGKLIVYNNFVKSEYTKDDFYSVDISEENDYVKFCFTEDEMGKGIEILDNAIIFENEFGSLVKLHGGTSVKEKRKIIRNLRKVYSDKKRSGGVKTLD